MVKVVSHATIAAQIQIIIIVRAVGRKRIIVGITTIFRLSIMRVELLVLVGEKIE